MQLKAVIFDGNGTIFYSEPKEIGIRKALLMHGVRRKLTEIAAAFFEARKITDYAKERRLLKLGKDAYLMETSIWLYILDAYSPRLARRINEDWSELMERKIYKDAKKVIQELSKKYKLGILTAGSEVSYIKTLRNKKLDKYFSAVVGEDTVNSAKPSSEGYFHVLNLLKVTPKEALMVGDNKKNDYLKPRSLGMNAVLLDRRITSPKALYLIRSLEQLPKIAHEINELLRFKP